MHYHCCRPFLQMDYNNIAVALLATVAGLRTFSAGRAVFYREAASGLNRCGCWAAALPHGCLYCRSTRSADKCHGRHGCVVMPP